MAAWLLFRGTEVWAQALENAKPLVYALILVARHLSNIKMQARMDDRRSPAGDDIVPRARYVMPLISAPKTVMTRDGRRVPIWRSVTQMGH